MTAKDVPNLLTGARIVLSMAVFAGLLAAAGLLPGQAEAPSPAAREALLLWTLAAFVAGAATDYFDGWLARRLGAQSPWGAMLDPIADKMAVCGVVLGLAALEPDPGVVIGGGLILFRELFVSGLREVGGARGLTFPVTRLAKWKTAAQLGAFSGVLLAAALQDPALALASRALLWLAVALTLWTGWEYARTARQGLRAHRPPG